MSGLNHIKKKIAEKELIIGTHVQFPCSNATELFAEIGYDFIWIDWEHTAMDRKDILSHIMAVKGNGTAAFVRVPWNVHYIIKPVLDMGVDGIVFPMIRTADEASRAIAACTYPPKGERGFGPLRANRYGLDDNLEYIEKKSIDSIWKIIQIEHKEGVDNLNEILDVEGVDALVVGENDLSGSLGKLGRPNDDLVQEYIERIVKVAHTKGVPLGVSTGYSGDTLEKWINRDAQWISTGSDLAFMAKAGIENLKKVRELMK